MDVTRLDTAGERTFVLVAAQGERAMASLRSFCREHQVSAAQITAVGAFARATLGWYDYDAQEYRHIEVDEQCELLSLVGDVAVGEDGPSVHAHAVVGLSDGRVRGGHLIEAEVRPTLEAIVRDAPDVLRKTFRPDAGLALIDLARTER